MSARLYSKRKITERDTLYRLECPEIAVKAKPGQFVEVRVRDALEPFFRRPISIFNTDGVYLDLLVRTVGRGTELMTEWESGQEIDIIGPLGSGFSWESSEKRFLLAGGGIGAAPLHFLARRLKQEGKAARMFFSPQRGKAVLDAFEAGLETEPRFAANRNEVAPVFLQILEEEVPDRVFVCGPDTFMEAVAKVCGERGIPVQVSMESRMACGIGICLGCVISVRSGEGIVYKKVCSDGPVFRGEEVVFHG